MTAPVAIISAMPSRETIWKRRAVLMATAGLVIGLVVTLLVREGEEPPASAEQLPALNPAVTDGDLAVRYQVPVGWDESTKREVIRMTSADQSAALTITAPVDEGRAARVLEDTLAVVRGGYEDASVERRLQGERVGGLEARSAVVSARNSEGVRLRLVISVASGERRTYLVQFFQAEGASAERRVQGQLVLGSLRLKG